MSYSDEVELCMVGVEIELHKGGGLADGLQRWLDRLARALHAEGALPNVRWTQDGHSDVHRDRRGRA